MITYNSVLVQFETVDCVVPRSGLCIMLKIMCTRNCSSEAMCEGKKIAHRQNTLFACPSSAVCFICVGKSYYAYLHILDVWPPSVCPSCAPRSEGFGSIDAISLQLPHPPLLLLRLLKLHSRHDSSIQAPGEQVI